MIADLEDDACKCADCSLGRNTITDKRGLTYVVHRQEIGTRHLFYYVLRRTGDYDYVARAAYHAEKGSVSDVLVRHDQDRRQGIAMALYDYIERDVGRALVPSRIRTADGKAFWRYRDAQRRGRRDYLNLERA